MTSLPEYDDAHPSRDPSYEPKTKRVTLSVQMEIVDEGDDRDTMRAAERALGAIIKEGNVVLRRTGNDYECDVEAIEVGDA